jgi:hypothetical protein
MDEFLVSGETMIRNLELGWHAAEAYGAAMPVGYLPDMFGTSPRCPAPPPGRDPPRGRLARRSGGDRPARVHLARPGRLVRPRRVPRRRLRQRGRTLLAIPDKLAEKVGRYAETGRAFYGDRSILAMYGTDHAVPSPALATIVADAKRRPRRHRPSGSRPSAITSVRSTPPLPIRTCPTRPRPRSGRASSGPPPGEHADERHVGPDRHQDGGRPRRAGARAGGRAAAALHGAAWPARLLELAWRKVVDNSAHDSICGCSRDVVVDQVLIRFAEAEQIGRGIATAAIRPLAAARATRHGRRRQPAALRADGCRRGRPGPAGRLGDGRGRAARRPARSDAACRPSRDGPATTPPDGTAGARALRPSAARAGALRAFARRPSRSAGRRTCPSSCSSWTTRPRRTTSTSTPCWTPLPHPPPIRTSRGTSRSCAGIAGGSWPPCRCRRSARR